MDSIINFLSNVILILGLLLVIGLIIFVIAYPVLQLLS